MDNRVEIVTVDSTNVAEQGFFCYKSKPKSGGYQKKLSWLKQRFAEGMRIKILYEEERSVGFIEYIPGEFAWRAVNAEGYVVIHCLWVVGRGKGKGYGIRSRRDRRLFRPMSLHRGCGEGNLGDRQ